MAKRWLFTLNNPTPLERLDTNLVSYLIVGDEVGAEGTPHHQGFVIFKEQTRLTALKKLLPRAHWEQARGTPFQNFVYCSKDGKFTEFGTRPTEPTTKQSADSVYFDAFNASTATEALQIIKTGRPRDYCLYQTSIQRSIQEAFAKPYAPRFKPDQFDRPLFSLEKPILFYGPTNVGKTQFALVHFKKPLLVSHIDQLKKLSPDNDGIVFDDMSFAHWPPQSVIHLLDYEEERAIHIRYGTALIPRCTSKIFTYNTSTPFYSDTVPLEQQLAIERRVTKIHCNAILYRR